MAIDHTRLNRAVGRPKDRAVPNLILEPEVVEEEADEGEAGAVPTDDHDQNNPKLNLFKKE